MGRLAEVPAGCVMIAVGFRQALAILGKDLWIEGTSWVRWMGLVAFAILILLLFSFAGDTLL